MFFLLSLSGNVVERSLRYNKRYIALPSPLTGVLFWRICLDEAQMVESTTAKVSSHQQIYCLNNFSSFKFISFVLYFTSSTC